ncbi:restriction endonuclease subunit S [Polaribacter sp. Q13]|uniref:restriction endonuclease subunit S n=1 Tax=Polaribacter sp. Q13 TaxID=2806551 RepID=UPI00193B94CA|nr:restriction endonuclease subunit S [Polaribacter sp. Q13]QVY66347.1 restriction endonuclease subunit S [Polaribacter sp. Q13]
MSNQHINNQEIATAKKPRNDVRVPKLRFKEFVDDWENDEFGELVRRPKSKYNPVKETLNLPCIELECLSQETGTLLKYFNSKEQKSIKNRFKKGEILFGKLRPYLKKYLKAPFDGVCSSEIWVLEGIKINNEYLYQLIQTHKYNLEVNITSGSKMPRAEWEYISSVKFKYPNLHEQKKITPFLTAVDDKIQQLTQKKTLLDLYKNGVMQQIFSQQLRFKADDGSEFSDWEIHEIGDFIKDRKITATLEAPLYSLTIEHGVVPKSKRYERSFLVKGKENAYKLMHPNDFALNPMNLRFGALARFKGVDNVAVSKYYDIFYCNDECNKDFLEYYLTSYNMIQYYNKMATGTLEEKKRVHYLDFIHFKKLFPSLEEQQKIAAYLSTIDTKIENVQTQIAKTQTFKKGLLQQMFV